MDCPFSDDDIKLKIWDGSGDSLFDIAGCNWPDRVDILEKVFKSRHSQVLYLAVISKAGGGTVTFMWTLSQSKPKYSLFSSISNVIF